MQMKQILIIDDEPDSIAILEILLNKIGYRIYSTTNPCNVLETLSNLHVELIILDWQMPEMDGMDVLKQIRSHTKFDNIPIIITTGVYIDSFDLKVAFDFGATDYLRKPINEIEFGARINNSFRLLECLKKNIDMTLEIKNKELEQVEAKAKLLQNELEKKEREMMAIAINIIQNKKFISYLKSDLLDSKIKFDFLQQKLMKQIFNKYDNMANSLNWELFEKIFIELNSNFFSNMATLHPSLTWGELRLCALFKIGFSLKEVSALNYSNYAAVRKAVYRIRKKIGINEKVDINLFLQKY